MAAKTKFKIWVHIEEVSIDSNGEEDVEDGEAAEPISAGVFPTLAKAEEIRDVMVEAVERAIDLTVTIRVVDALTTKFDVPPAEARAMVERQKAIVSGRALAGDSVHNLAKAVIAAESKPTVPTDARCLEMYQKESGTL